MVHIRCTVRKGDHQTVVWAPETQVFVGRNDIMVDQDTGWTVIEIHTERMTVEYSVSADGKTVHLCKRI